MLLPKTKLIKSEKHRRWIADNFPCVICKNPEVQVAHIRHLPKGNVGLGLKNDAFVLPLCVLHHREQHTMNEIKFWLKYNINPILIAIKLCTLSKCIKVNTLKESGYFNGNTNYFRVLQKDSLQQ